MTFIFQPIFSTSNILVEQIFFIYRYAVINKVNLTVILNFVLEILTFYDILCTEITH